MPKSPSVQEIKAAKPIKIERRQKMMNWLKKNGHKAEDVDGLILNNVQTMRAEICALHGTTLANYEAALK